MFRVKPDGLAAESSLHDAASAMEDPSCPRPYPFLLLSLTLRGASSSLWSSSCLAGLRFLMQEHDSMPKPAGKDGAE